MICARDAGQALPLGLFFMLGAAAVMYFVFNSGRAVDEKLRITNAADGAAYSVAVLEARALNFDAYSNRAIVANQVAIAQAVSLASWLHYFGAGVDNADALADVASSWIYDPLEYPRLARVVAGFGGTAYVDHLGGGVTDGAIRALDEGLAAIVSAHDLVSQALSRSQSVLHGALGAGTAQRALANEIVHRIDPAMTAELVAGSHGFDAFTRAYSKGDPAGDGRGRLAETVLSSRDAFTAERRWSIGGPDIWPLQRNVELKRRGGTDLINYDEWRAIDTLEHEGQRLRKGSWRWRRTSLAWGAAAADNGEGTPGTGFHGGTYVDNRRTTKMYAEPSMLDLAELGARFSGLPTTRDLARLEQSGTAATGVSLRVSKPRPSLRMSGGVSLIQPSGRLQRFDATPPGDEIAALSRAEVFFERIDERTDGRREYPSLYSPYWEVRLVSPTAIDRAWAAARQEGALLP